MAPATALSLRATDPDLFWFGMPRIVQWAIYGACFFLVWFLFAVAKSELKHSDDKTSGQGAQAANLPLLRQLRRHLRATMNTTIALVHFLTSILTGLGGFFTDPRLAPLAGAGLGACFYILIKLQPYLENRSFDPKYAASYVTRFVIGVVAGVILAAIVNAYVVCKTHGEEHSIKCLSPAIVAILGSSLPKRWNKSSSGLSKCS